MSANAIQSGGPDVDPDADANPSADGSRGNWTPATETSGALTTATIGTADTGPLAPLREWLPLVPPDPTSVPSNARYVLELRQEQGRGRGDEREENGTDPGEYNDGDDYFRANADQSSRICATGLPLNRGWVVACGAGRFCSADNDNARVGCCRNDDCTIATACVDARSPDNQFDSDTIVWYVDRVS